jgi:hypothetical protein
VQNGGSPDFLARWCVQNLNQSIRRRKIMEDYLFTTILLVIVTALGVLVELIRTSFEI